MKVHINTGFDRTRCLVCNRIIKPGEQYTIEMTFPKDRQDLKMSYKYRDRHYPNCEKPGMWEEGLIKDRVGYKTPTQSE